MECTKRNIETTFSLPSHPYLLQDKIFYLSALTIASLSGQEKVVEYLIQRGSDLEMVNSKGHSPIHCAAKAGHWQILQILLDKGLSMEMTDRHQRTALMVAASEGKVGVLEMLLSKGNFFCILY